ncbi:DUF3800 domain-containing protein [Photobacterium damselae subsp. damselae]|uniref:DUF3800 domain-containing protein n=1 Tax=Photobacterium damselae TaxID=38293 RepID=UPI00311AD9C6
MKLVVNADTSKSIYLDERGDRNPHAKSNLDYFFIGGIEVLNSKKQEIAGFVREFKAALYPDQDPSTWELKGASSPSFISEPSFSKEENGKLHKQAAKRKWLLWAKALQNIGLDYHLHGCFIKLSDFLRANPKCTEKDVIKSAFINVAYKFVNFSCVDQLYPFDERWDYMLSPSAFYFDNVTNLQEQSILEAFKEYPEHYPHIANGFCVDNNLNFITNENYDDNDELIMQFIDMQIYALTRMLCPVRVKDKNTSNILINFEEYVYILPKLQSGELKLPTEELKDIVELYYGICPIFGDLRNRFHRYGWLRGQQATSLSLIAEKVHEDFGFEAHIDIAHFTCLKIPDGEIYKILNRPA